MKTERSPASRSIRSFLVLLSLVMGVSANGCITVQVQPPKEAAKKEESGAKASSEKKRVVEGRKFRWSASVPSTWIGGPYIVWREMSSKAPADLKSVVDAMATLAKNTDVALLYVGDGTHSAGISIIVMDAVPLDDPTLLQEEATRAALWKLMAKRVEEDHSEGSSYARTELVNTQKSRAVGGRASYEATFRTITPKRETVYDVVQIIDGGEGLMQTLKLQVYTQGDLDDRYQEFQNIVQTLRYDVR